MREFARIVGTSLIEGFLDELGRILARSWFENDPVEEEEEDDDEELFSESDDIES